MEKSVEYLIELREKIRKVIKDNPSQQSVLRKKRIIQELGIDEETYKAALYFKAPWDGFADKVERFKRKNGELPVKDYDYKDVMAKFGDSPKCYLTGASLDYYNMISLDHIVPSINGGSNELDNMGLVAWWANILKGMSKAESFIQWFTRQCIDFLEYHGYKVEKL